MTTREEAEAFTQGLGNVSKGQYQLVLFAVDAGVPEALGLTTPEWVETRLGGYVKLGIEERREVEVELRDNGMSQRAIADVLGVSHETVRRDLGTNVPPVDDDQEEHDDLGTNVPTALDADDDERAGQLEQLSAMADESDAELAPLRDHRPIAALTDLEGAVVRVLRGLEQMHQYEQTLPRPLAERIRQRLAEVEAML